MTANTKSVTRVLIVVSVEQDKERYQSITDLFKGTVLEIANRMDFANGSMKEGVVSQSLMDFGEIAATGEYDLITGSQVGFKTKPEDWQAFYWLCNRAISTLMSACFMRWWRYRMATLLSRLPR